MYKDLQQLKFAMFAEQDFCKSLQQHGNRNSGGWGELHEAPSVIRLSVRATSLFQMANTGYGQNYCDLKQILGFSFLARSKQEIGAKS